MRVHGRVSKRRPVAAVRTPKVKASRIPAIEAITRKRRRFGENTGVGSGEVFSGGGCIYYDFFHRREPLYFFRNTTDCEASALVVPILRTEARREEVLVVRGRGRVSM